MNSILAGLLGMLLNTNEPAMLSDLAAHIEAQGVARQLHVTNTNDPVYVELRKIMVEDDKASDDVDKWAKEAEAFEAQGAGTSKAALQVRAENRFEEVKKLYAVFLEAHPAYAPGHLAYGSFLYDFHDEDGAVAAWDKARELDPQNPASWNNLANHYGHRGPVAKAFGYYAKAMELNPKEVVYVHNLATTVYLFRKDAQEFYHINEQEVFDKSLALYQRALELSPADFVLASDYAQSFYGIKPLRSEEALAAWRNALKLAKNDLEREGVYLHLARVELNSGQFNEARDHLNLVTNTQLAELKSRLTRNLTLKEKGPPPATTIPSEK